MRWDQLFRDLEGQLDLADAAELAAEVADRTRREAGQLRFVDRLVPAIGHPVQLQVQGAGYVAGLLEHVSVDSLLVREEAGRYALVPLGAVLAVAGLSARSASAGNSGRVFEHLRLPSAVRALARDRTCVQLVLRDGSPLRGTVDRVGEDFLELAEHAPGEPRRQQLVTGARVVALGAVAVFFSC